METKLDALRERRYECEELAEASDEAEADGDAQLEAQLDALDRDCKAIRAQLDALQRARIDTSGYDKATLGAVVTTDAGVLKIRRGLMLAKEAKAEEQRQRAVAKGDAASADPAAPKAAEFSEKLMADLTSHRTAALQVALTDNVPVALAVLADRLCAQVFTPRCSYGGAYGYGSNGDVLQISLKPCQSALEQNGTALAESKASKRFQQQREHWEALMPGAAAERLSWLLLQPQETVLSLIVFCTASTADVIARRAAANPKADAIAEALHFDMADWWSVGVDNFLTHVSKARIAAVVTEACGAEAAAPLAAMKKADACAKAAELLLDLRWLPAPLRATRLDVAPADKSDAESTGSAADAG